MRLGVLICLLLTLPAEAQDNLTSFTSGGQDYQITVHKAAADGMRRPLVVVLHGNAGLIGEFGREIRKAAKTIANEGYNVAVPKYYTDDQPHLTDTTPKRKILSDAIEACKTLSTVDPDRIGLVGYSLGAATSMSFIASEPSGTVKTLVDYFGPVPPSAIREARKFPPTIIFHNKNDRIVPIDESSRRLMANLRGDHEIHEYDESFREINHRFNPGGPADNDAQKKTLEWLAEYLPLD